MSDNNNNDNDLNFDDLVAGAVEAPSMPAMDNHIMDSYREEDLLDQYAGMSMQSMILQLPDGTTVDDNMANGIAHNAFGMARHMINNRRAVIKLLREEHERLFGAQGKPNDLASKLEESGIEVIKIKVNSPEELEELLESLGRNNELLDDED